MTTPTPTTKSDTPETDKACVARMSGYMTGAVDAEFARRLERERDGWKLCAENLAGVLSEFSYADESLLKKKDDVLDSFDQKQ